MSEGFGAVGIKPDLHLEHLSSARNKEEAENLALKMATVDIELPLSFNQITTILKKRIKELDKIQEAILGRGNDIKIGFFKRLLWKFIKICKGGCKSTNEPLDLTRVEENKLLDKCMSILSGIIEPMKDDDLMPAGQALLIVPKIHMIEMEISGEETYVNHHSKCPNIRLLSVNMTI